MSKKRLDLDKVAGGTLTTIQQVGRKMKATFVPDPSKGYGKNEIGDFISSVGGDYDIEIRDNTSQTSEKTGQIQYGGNAVVTFTAKK